MKCGAIKKPTATVAVRPRRFEEIESNGTSLLNEPISSAIPLRPLQTVRPIHAVLCEALTNTQSLLTRLESGV
jgi:hypothetical protein